MTTVSDSRSKETIYSAINWPLVVTAYATMFCLGTLDNIRGPFFPDVTRDLHLTNFQAAFFYAVVSGMAFVSGAVVAKSVQRFGQLPVLRIGQITMAVGFAILSRVETFWQMIGACIVFGLGFGVLNVAQNLLILNATSTIGPDNGVYGPRRRLLSGLHSMYAFASIVAPLVAAYFFRIGGNWREVFLIAAVFVLSSFFISFWPSSNTRTTASEAAGCASTSEPAKSAKLPVGRLWLVACMLSFYSLAELTVSSRLALYLRHGFGYKPAVAAEDVALFYSFLLIGRLIFFFFHFRWSTRSIIGWALVGTIAFFLIGLSWRPDILVLCGLFMAPVFCLGIDYIAELFPENPSVAVNNCIAISCLFIVLMHILLGILTDQYGIARAFTVAPVFAGNNSAI